MATTKKDKTTIGPEGPVTAEEPRKNTRLENVCERLPEFIGRDDPELMALVKGSK